MDENGAQDDFKFTPGRSSVRCVAIGNLKTRDMKLDIKAYNMGKERKEAFVCRETDDTHCSQVLATHTRTHTHTHIHHQLLGCEFCVCVIFLSLSLTHTPSLSLSHTHTHTSTRRYGFFRHLFAAALEDLHICIYYLQHISYMIQSNGI
jgi:hypothetical protein